MLNYYNTLHSSLALLCGNRQPFFESESLLRQFQFKIWLRSNKGLFLYGASGMLFAANMINKHILSPDEGVPEENERKQSSSSKLINAIRKYRKMFNANFKHISMLDFESYLDYDALLKQSDYHNSEIKALNEQTLLQVRLFKSKMNPSRTKAWSIYNLRTTKKPGFIKRSKLIEIYKQRSQQQCYLFVAQNLYPNLLHLDDDIDLEIKERSLDSTQWSDYLSCVICTMDYLKLDAKPLSRATKLSAKAWGSFNPFSNDEMEQADLKAKPRRSASQTAKTKR